MNMTSLLRHRSRRLTVVLAFATGVLLVAATAVAATNWVVGLNSNSSANAQGSSIQSLTISKITSAPTLTNKLAPGGSGDVQFTLTNPNPFAVTVTAVTIPASSSGAAGFSDTALSSAIAGCATSSSLVTWQGAGASQASKTLTAGSGAFTVAASATITVTMANDASMDSNSPLACAGTGSGTAPNLTYAGAYFVMPPLVTLTATGGAYAGQPAVVANGGSVTTGY